VKARRKLIIFDARPCSATKFEHLKKLNQYLKFEMSRFHHFFEEHEAKKVEISREILKDLQKHAINIDEEYCESTIDLALRIHSVSARAYPILVEELYFPSINIVRYRFEKSISIFPEKLVHFENLYDVVQIYKEKTGISKSNPMDACLSVDAIYFTSDISITNEFIFTGIDLDETQEESSRSIVSPEFFPLFAILSISSNQETVQFVFD